MDSAELIVSSAGRGRGIPRFRRLRRSWGYLFAAICFVWVFHDFQPRHLREQLAALQWKWIPIAVAADILSYLCQGMRWQLLLRPVGSLSVLQTTQAIYIGLFANELLPMRVGELVRGYLISRRLRIKFLLVLPSLIVERFFDGVWLALGIALAAMFVPLPRNLLVAGDALGILLLIGIGGLVYLILRRKQELAHRPPTAVGRSLRAVQSSLLPIAAAFEALGTSGGFYLAFCLSLGVLLLQALALWAVMLAYALKLSFWMGLVVLLILHLGTAIPNAPANVGTYQFFCVVGLTLFGVDKPLAAGFSVVAFVILTMPLWIIGGLVLGQTGSSVAAMRGDVNHLMGRRD